jgi:hypothetical protein
MGSGPTPPVFIEGQPAQDLAGRTAKSLKFHHPAAIYFGRAALKYQPQPRNLKAVTQLACKHIDVVTASGESAGIAANLFKIKKMHAAAGGQPRAIAGGITVENRRGCPHIAWCLIATGLSIILTKGVDFRNPDPILVARLQERISAEGELLQDFWPFPPLYKGYNKWVRYNI